ncbi:MAG: MATE family efflux transporter [Caulobacteraceae bacterium]|nr:MATE family efflux transporter [Caulobacteraceae bacterium]
MTSVPRIEPAGLSGASAAPLPWRRARTMLGLSAPVMAVLMAQNLAGLAALAMVGRIGIAAVAGVGVAGGVYAMLQAVLYGLDAGVQALVARRSGAGDAQGAGAVLNDALALALGVGLVLAAAAYGLGPALIGLVVHDPAVIAAAKAYLAALTPSLVLLSAAYPIIAYWNGAGVPKFTLLVTVFELPFGVALTAVLVFGGFGLPRLGVVGAGLGSTLAALLGLGVHLLLAAKVVRVPGFLARWPSLEGMLAVARLGLPISLQQSLLYVGLMIFVGIVARLGAQAMAAGSVLNSLMLVSVLTATGVGVAAATLAGGALGRGDPADARRWGWQAGWLGVAVVLPFSLALLAAPRAALGLFVHDPATVALAVWPLRILAAGMAVDAFGRVVGMALRGTGATRTAAIVGFLMQWVVQLPLAWWLGVRLGYGLAGVCATQLLFGMASLAVLAVIWRGRSWDWTTRASALGPAMRRTSNPAH